MPLLVLAILLLPLGGCEKPLPDSNENAPAVFLLENGGRLTLEVGNTLQLRLRTDDASRAETVWTASNGSVTVDENGLVTAVCEGKVAVSATCRGQTASALIEVITASEAFDDAEKDAFYANYTPADSYEEAKERSEKGLMSGDLTVPDQAPTLSAYRPTHDGRFVRNDEPYFLDSNTYVVVDAYGEIAFTVYRGGAYITLEEVAAYVFAFGDVPANYVSGKNAEPEGSIWGEYLRLNHSAFSGDTKKYPYEPVLPDISGCGGSLYYYEIDIGTTGTDCDPRYMAKIYNDGKSITRGAARIVYTRYDRNKNQITEPNEKYLFYTYNHYNDFQEYLNYEGGWGEMFGNVTGGGSLSSKTDYNPTPYVPSVMGSLKKTAPAARSDALPMTVLYFDPRTLALLLSSRA